MVHGPRVILGKLLDLLGADWLDVLIESVGADGLDQVLDSLFYFIVLTLQFLSLSINPFGLHLHKLVKGISSCVGRQVDQDGLGKRLEVVFDTVLHDVIDVDDELLKLAEALVHVLQVAIDVHRGPCEHVHTRAELVLQVFEMGN